MPLGAYDLSLGLGASLLSCWWLNLLLKDCGAWELEEQVGQILKPQNYVLLSSFLHK
jgi:hypothetical protein